MNSTGIGEQVIKEIISLAEKHGITKIILFGSRARGDFHRVSDIDLAVYGGDVSGFSLDVEEYTSTLLTYDVIDMKKEHQEKLLESIKREGKVLYENNTNNIFIVAVFEISCNLTNICVHIFSCLLEISVTTYS